jgi:threonine dehydrogenase-like Zn-dependent dehydrogenase
MKAAVVTEPGVLEIADVASPVPRDHEVIVQVDTCGICGTDVHVLDGDYGVVRYPVIPGHEFAGTVTEVGSAVRGLDVGALVAVDPMDYCDACEMCRSGWTNMCTNGGGLGTTAPGALAEYVAVNALDRLGPVLGADTLVLGSGPIGLLLTSLLSMAGATVDVVDRNASRLVYAPKFGAARIGSSAAELASPNWAVIVDATGNPLAVRDAFAFARRTARIALLGVSGPGNSFPFEPFDIVARELTVLGVNSVRHTFGRAARLLASGRIPAELLHEDALPLSETAEALRRAHAGEGLKTRVRVSQGAP